MYARDHAEGASPRSSPLRPFILFYLFGGLKRREQGKLSNDKKLETTRI